MDEYPYDDLKTNPKCIRICIITNPFPSEIAGHTLLSSFIKVLEPLPCEIFVITGISFLNNLVHKNNIHIMNVTSTKRPLLLSIIRYILAQIRMSMNLIKVSKKIDIVIFFLGNPTIPVLVAFLLNKKIVTIVTGSGSKSAERKYATHYIIGKIYFNIVKVLERIRYTLSDCIVVYSENIISQLGLEKYRNKISIAHEHFLDFDKFKIKKQLDERDNLVGYIGRLSEEKGVLNFVKAIPEIMKKRGDLEFLVGGDGQLRDKIEEYLDVASLNDKVKLIGWIPDEEFSTYLNELKLFVLPSYTEGLPHIILGAMACGTPVLATPVGAIPDVIKDGETGFIMENNSPECITKNIARALAHPNINEITKNARTLVEEKYNYQAAIDGYRIILSSTF